MSHNGKLSSPLTYCSPPKKGRSEWNWVYFDHEGVRVGRKGMPSKETSARIAAFDFDGTIYYTKSGSFPKDANDIVIMDKFPERLKAISQTHEIVIFTNQLGIKYKKISFEELTNRLETVLNEALGDIACIVFISEEENYYRKPRRGMFEMYEKQFHEGAIDKMESFFVGDGAGRPAEAKTKRKKDHSRADHLFARNCGLRFFIPEDFAAGKISDETWKYNERTLPLPFDPHSLKNKPENVSIFSSQKIVNCDLMGLSKELSSLEERNDRLVVVMVGLPGSGKSSLRKKFFSSYSLISQDTTGSAAKCLKDCTLLMKDSKFKIVIDNTNILKSQRSPWIDLSKKAGAHLICVHITTDVEVCLHNNLYRRLRAMAEGKESKAATMVPTFVITNMKKKLEVPNLEEGFDKIVEVSFSPSFDDLQMESLYYQFLTGVI